MIKHKWAIALGLLLAAALLLSTGLLSEAAPMPQETPQSGLTATPTIDVDAARSSTNGIVVGAIVLVLIIVGGSLLTLRRWSK